MDFTQEISHRLETKVLGRPILSPLCDRRAGVGYGKKVEPPPGGARTHHETYILDRARPGVVIGLGVWWRKFGLNGTNVNQLTSQNLTDLGHGPTFYDCLVEVQPHNA